MSHRKTAKRDPSGGPADEEGAETRGRVRGRRRGRGVYHAASPWAHPICSSVSNDLSEQWVHAVLAVVTHAALRRVSEPVITPTDPASLFSPHREFQKDEGPYTQVHEEPANSSPGCPSAALWAATSHRWLNELNSVPQSL